ncbi:MAG: chromosome segregation protein SMC [Cyclobacteriaceae bacterium]|jgi:cell division protein ZapB|nr:chromosome segregation protein SMC [Cyclobacteriaceae bacterium]
MSTPVEPKKSSKSPVIIALLGAIVIAQSAWIYFDYKKDVVVQEQKIEVEEELATTMQKLNDISKELDQKIIEIEKLGGDISELQKAKAEIEKEMRRSTQRSSKAINELKAKVEGYEELLKIKDEEIDQLKAVNKELFTENRTLKTTQNKLSDSINRLSKNKEELATKVAIASQLKAENFVLRAVNNKGKERDSPFKNRQIEKLKIEFTLAENKVAPIEGKNILIRIVDENGQVLFDVARGSGTFMFNGKEEFYTASQEILFDNTRQKITFFYEKGSDYVPGSYTLEAYADDYLMGSATFEVK